MDDVLLCPACGAVNPVKRTSCAICAQPLVPAAQFKEGLEPILFPLPAQEPQSISTSYDDQQYLPLHDRQRLFMEVEPQVKIVRPSNRRKFLVGLLAGGTALTFSGVGISTLLQNLRSISLMKKIEPDSNRSMTNWCSPDLMLAAFTKSGQGETANAKLYIWDFTQQRVTHALPTGPLGYTPLVWSLDNRYLLNQSQDDQSYTLEIWDIVAQRKIRSYTGKDHVIRGSNWSTVTRWSPDGSQIAFSQGEHFSIRNAASLDPFFEQSLASSYIIDDLAWSPDGQRIAILGYTADSASWSVKIWQVQQRAQIAEALFTAEKNDPNERRMLVWSPDASHIAVLSHQQLNLLNVDQGVSAYALD